MYKTLFLILFVSYSFLFYSIVYYSLSHWAPHYLQEPRTLSAAYLTQGTLIFAVIAGLAHVATRAYLPKRSKRKRNKNLEIQDADSE